jgi:hypothetical protein
VLLEVVGVSDRIDKALDKAIQVTLVFLIAVIVCGALITVYKWMTGGLK